MALSLLDLRVVLLCMCVLSFVLTFLYVDDFDTRASSDGRVTHQVTSSRLVVRVTRAPRVGCPARSVARVWGGVSSKGGCDSV
jgi:hypothetical protein